VLGRQSAQAGDYELAIRHFERAVALEPTEGSIHLELGNAYAQAGKAPQAVHSYGAALRLEPNSAWAWNNLGNVLLQLNNAQTAVSCYENAVRSAPGMGVAHYGLGRALNLLGRHEPALEHLQMACRLNPGHADSWLNLGNAHQYLGRFDEALRCFDRALPLSSEPAEVHVNRAVILLNRGDFSEGWREYEYRWETPGFSAYKKRPLGKPQWQGESLEGKCILLHAEQGFGDAIQFARFIPAVLARGAEVYLEVRDPLKELLAGLVEPGHILVRGEPLPAFDYHCSLLSLPIAMGLEFDSIPSRPYLSVGQSAREDARRAIEKETDGLSSVRAGIAWRGNPQHRENLLRSLQLSQLTELFSVPGVRWFVLQKDATAAELASLPAGVSTLPPQHLDGFLATGAVIQELDLVVSIDSVTAHLTGALGKPLWLLLPAFSEWRWHSHLESSPWYPSARLFRQTVPGDWTHPVQQLRTALAEMAREPRN
jgi:tetratricopeptide (TPR) repeat protein